MDEEQVHKQMANQEAFPATTHIAPDYFYKSEPNFDLDQTCPRNNWNFYGTKSDHLFDDEYCRSNPVAILDDSKSIPGYREYIFLETVLAMALTS